MSSPLMTLPDRVRPLTGITGTPHGIGAGDVGGDGEHGPVGGKGVVGLPPSALELQLGVPSDPRHAIGGGKPLKTGLGDRGAATGDAGKWRLHVAPEGS